MASKGLIRLIRIFCVIELLALAPFAVPYLNVRHVATLDMVNQVLGGGALPAVDALHYALAGVLGCISAGFALWRWTHPTIGVARFEGVTRIGVGGWLMWIGILLSAPLLLILAVVDMFGGLAHLWMARRS